MGTVDIWPTIWAERESLASDLKTMEENQWATTSLCSEWPVRTVVAHMTATARISPSSFFPKLAGSGFSLSKMQAKDIERELGDSPAETLSRFEGIVQTKGHPPGPRDTMLGEVMIHSEDIRRPLGLRRDYPKDAMVEVAEFYKGSNLIIGTKRRIAGLTLRATDTDWSTGSGSEVSGPIASLVMAMTGRKAVLDDLSGEGVATLRDRP